MKGKIAMGVAAFAVLRLAAGGSAWSNYVDFGTLSVCEAQSARSDLEARGCVRGESAPGKFISTPPSLVILFR